VRRTSIASILGIGVSWGLLWLAIMAGIMGIIGIVDPDSIDPGEPQMFLLVFGPMGLLSELFPARGWHRRRTFHSSRS
jgi:hypothetical protein